MLYKSIIKIICLLLIIGFSWTGLLAIGQTFPFFNDIETSKDNSLQAGTLDFSLYLVYLEHYDDEVEKTIEIRNEGNLSFQYIVRVEITPGNCAFCSALQLEAKLGGTVKHNNNYISLMKFESYPIKMVIQNEIHTWGFEVSLPDNDSFIGQRCELKFVFKAWQINLDKNQGFGDIEKTEIIIIESDPY